MNRRDFLKALMAVPIMAIALPEALSKEANEFESFIESVAEKDVKMDLDFKEITLDQVDADSPIQKPFLQHLICDDKDVGVLESLSLPSYHRELIDVTLLDSDKLDGARLYNDSLFGRRTSEIEITTLFEKEKYDWIVSKFESGELSKFQIDMDDTVFNFEGYIVNIIMNVPVEEIITLTMNIKISGQVTVTT